MVAAQEEMTALMQRLLVDAPTYDANQGVLLTPLDQEIGARFHSALWVLLGAAFCLDSVGINRREVVNERVIQERSSEPSWPRAM